MQQFSLRSVADAQRGRRPGRADRRGGSRVGPGPGREARIGVQDGPSSDPFRVCDSHGSLGLGRSGWCGGCLAVDLELIVVEAVGLEVVDLEVSEDRSARRQAGLWPGLRWHQRQWPRRRPRPRQGDPPQAAPLRTAVGGHGSGGRVQRDLRSCMRYFCSGRQEPGSSWLPELASPYHHWLTRMPTAGSQQSRPDP